MKDDKKKKILIISIVIILILIIILSAIIVSVGKNGNKETQQDNKTTQANSSSNKKDEEKIRKLKKVSESERIRTYLGDYFSYLENKDYESAYNLLYPKFRENYFPDLDLFKEYLEKNKYPEMYSINYNDIRLQGSYYIVKLDIGDFLDSTKVQSENYDKTFVIKEEDYNKFYLSFKL